MKKCGKCGKSTDPKRLKSRIINNAIKEFCLDCAQKYDLTYVLTTVKVQNGIKQRIIERFGSLQQGLNQLLNSWYSDNQDK